MALLLHYTGQDYISRGLLKTELTPGSTSAIVGGCKTGKGFDFDGTVNSAFEINGITDSEKFSIDFWYYTGANVTTQQSIFSDYSQVSGRIDIRVINGAFTAFTYNTSGEFTNAISGTIVINTWYHVAVTVDTIGNLSIYLNGMLQQQLAIAGTVKSSSGLYSIGKRHTNQYLLLNGTKICNFKYYDHVLSQREIAEDYKSLILHYPLKNENEISPYIALNKVETFPVQTAGLTQTQISKYHLHIIGSWSGTPSVSYPYLRKAWNQYVDGNTYTVTFTYRLNSYSNLRYVELRHSRWVNDYHKSERVAYQISQFPLGEWFTVTLTRKFDSTDPSSINPLHPNFEIYASIIKNNQPSNFDLEIKDVYVTEGESILPYPTTNTGAILDVSGFQRHITNLTSNTVTLDSKAQVYSASLKNDGTQALVGTSDLTDLNGIPEISISFRVYKENTRFFAILTNRTIVGIGISIFIDKTEIYVDMTSRRIHSYTLPLNEWVNICITQSATEQKLYANGVLVSTMTPSSLSGIGNYTSISNSNVSGGAIDYKLNGNVQDIRLYATALTQEDVTELYQTRHMIDKSSNCYTYELIEGQSKVGMNKQGQLLCDEVIENEDGTFQIVSNKTIKTKQVKEV